MIKILFLSLVIYLSLRTRSVNAEESNLLYPHGSDHGDLNVTKGDDKSFEEIKASVPFPFFKKIYSNMFINTNGIISFKNPIPQYIPEKFPVKRENLTVIAPYWSDIDTSSKDSGQILVRQTTKDEDLDMITKDIIKAFPKFKKFKTLWALIATWKDVTPYGANDTKLKNTFQAALATNGKHSFVIYNYPKLTWTSSYSVAGNASGLGGKSAQAGFNEGDGKKYLKLPGSGTPKILEIAKESNIKTPGKWIYRTDQNKIEKGGCNTKGALVIEPSSGSMLGGTLLKITGPCLDMIEAAEKGETEQPDDKDESETQKPNKKEKRDDAQKANNKGQYIDAGELVKNERVKCMIGNELIDANVDVKKGEIACITPTIPWIGRVPILVSLDGGDTFPFMGILNTGNTDTLKPEITRRNMLNWTQSPEPPYYIQWDPEKLPKTKEVDVDLMGYAEKDGKIEPKFYPIAHDVPNTGNYNIEPWRVANRPKDIKVGALRITPKRSPDDQIEIRNTPMLWSDIHPLGWFLRGDNPPHVFAQDAQRICQQALEADKRRPVQMLDVPACPCTQWQAKRDILSFERDPVCEAHNHYYPLPPDRMGCPAKGNDTWSCFRSIFPGKSGTGQQCCYTKEGRLLLNQKGDKGAGTIQLAHPKGCMDISPFDPRLRGPNAIHKYAPKQISRTNNIPIVSNLIIDEFPALACCHWSPQTTGLCREYMNRRPSGDCHNYEPPRIGLGFGDPHIITLDGLSYTFNGLGEFIILHLNGDFFEVQGRTQRVLNLNGRDLRATSWKALAFKEKGKKPIHVEIGDNNALDIYIDNKLWDETNDGELNQKNVSYKMQDYDIKRHNDNSVDIVFKEGILIQINATQNVLIFKIALPRIYKNKTRGLLGIWNDDITDDLTTPEGQIIRVDASPEILFQDFGLSWAIPNANKSILHYTDGLSHAICNKELHTFRPVFDWTAELDELDQETIQDLCGNSMECAYDYALTHNQEIALSSKQTYADYISQPEHKTFFNLNRVCKSLTEPENGSIIKTSNLPGSISKYGCKKGFLLQGPSTRYCLKDGTWTGASPMCVPINSTDLSSLNIILIFRVSI